MTGRTLGMPTWLVAARITGTVATVDGMVLVILEQDDEERYGNGAYSLHPVRDADGNVAPVRDGDHIEIDVVKLEALDTAARASGEATG